ncbi:hypothetical protein LTR37_009554 [Vermiconidia calcicola]|uniref:Uncharacterized protein n=1 Tax=Vermiconidia calcicola TaxID=1690605 RepID=A0ACC3N7H4_9PEZI|nr:hypothetical protein LTR37_009554 [Vermiconidia calcicola]
MTGSPLPTPPPSVRPSIETLPKMETETPERQQQGSGKTMKGSFEYMQGLDRQAVKTYVSNLIKVRGSKWLQMTEKDRESFVKSEMLKKMDARERPSGSKASTARFKHPTKWSEEREVAWVLKYFRNDIEGGETGAAGNNGQDDEEELPQSSVARVKQEIPDERSEDMRKHQPFKECSLSYTKDGEEVQDEEEDEDDAPKRTATARCRALSIVQSPTTATKPYWGWNESMELVVVWPCKKSVDEAGPSSSSLKRNREGNEHDAPKKTAKA